MHQREQENCARHRRTASALNEIGDQIRTSRHLVDAAFIVAEELTVDQRDPLMTLLDLISDKLQATAAEIDERAKKEITDAA